MYVTKSYGMYLTKSYGMYLTESYGTYLIDTIDLKNLDNLTNDLYTYHKLNRMMQWKVIVSTNIAEDIFGLNLV